MSRTPAATTRVYGSLRGWGGGVLLSALVLAAALSWAGRAGAAKPELDCAQPAEARRLIGLLTLAEIEGAEDIHRAATWDALGRCPAGAAGEPCRDGVRRRSATVWERQKRQIEAKYRTMLAEFEERCFASITRLDGRPWRAAG